SPPVQQLHLSSQYPRTPLTLHSFPTRRSSDLIRRDGCGRSPAQRQREEEGDAAFGQVLSPDPSSVRLDDPATDGRIWAQNLPEGDRKSTRLNSCHVAISYAVFCLKKQNLPLK